MIPSQLESEEPTFLRIAERSKAPKRGNSAKTGPFYHASDSELISHLGSGGNIARVLRDDLVAFDVDTQRLDELLENELGSTFTVESGGTGFGFHRYYRCSEWDTNHIQFSDDGVNLGSLRTGNSYCLAPPSEHDETRDRYTVSNDRQIRSVSVGSLDSVVSELKSQHQPAAAAAAGVGSASQTDRGGTDESIPSEYPNRDRPFSECKQILSQNDLLEKLNRTSSSDWSGTEFVLCKCLAEQGTSVDSIYNTLSRLHRSAKWHNGSSSLSVSEYRSLTVQKAIEKACTDPYVEFGTGDMEASEASESRKTESGDGNRTTGGENDMNYNTKENLTVYNADSVEEAKDGDRVIRVELTNMTGTGDDGEPVDTDFVTITKGTLKENGDFGVAPEFPGQSKSVGAASPEDLRLIAEGLEEMAEQVEE